MTATCPSASRNAGRLGTGGPLRADPAARGRTRQGVRAPRRPAVRERRHPPRPRGQQDAEGRRGEVARCWPASARRTCPAGTVMACRSRSRSRRKSARSGDKLDAADLPPEVSRICAAADRPAAHRLQAPRRIRRLGPSVPHDGFQVRGRHDARAGEASLRMATSCAASSRCTGVSIAVRRSPRRKSNTPTRPRLPSTSPTTRSIRRALAQKFGVDAGDAIVAVPIWTTTPWTLPASLAVSLGAELEYALIEGAVARWRRVLLVVASALAEKAAQRYGRGARAGARPRGRSGAAKASLLKHPFYAREVPVLLGEHVSAEDGTGAVHTSPDHGVEDFAVRPELWDRHAQLHRKSAERSAPIRRQRSMARSSPASTYGRRTTSSSSCCASAACCSPLSKSRTAIRIAGVTRRR